MPTNTDLGRAIRRLRREQRLTIETLALDAGMHPTYLSGIERGIRNPTWERIRSLALTLDMPVSAVVQTAEQEAEFARITREARERLQVRNPAIREVKTSVLPGTYASRSSLV
jgi:transcriptional regulator with XRE-family HTH domain